MERRQNDRFASGGSAEVRYRTGRRMMLDLLDISLGGCMVDARGWAVEANENVTIRLPGLTWQPARVVWIEDQRAGIALDEPLYEPTFLYIRSLIAA